MNDLFNPEVGDFHNAQFLPNAAPQRMNPHLAPQNQPLNG